MMEDQTKGQPLLPQEWPGVAYFDNLEVRAAARVVESRSLFRFYGPKLQREVEQFEKEFAAFLGLRFCLGVSSGSAALQVALAALGIGVGDEVLVPGYFWVATVSAVVRSGAVPRLVDVDDSFSLDPEDLGRKISTRTKAVIVVHMGGVMGQIAAIQRICSEKKICLLEDCAQAVGATQNGKPAGSLGDLAIFSFQLNKNMTAGEGGAIVTNRQDLYQRIEAIHDLGFPRNENGRLIFDNEQMQYWGIGCRMSEITGAILRVQLRKLPEIVKSMREFNIELRSILQAHKVRCRSVPDPEGMCGGFLEVILDNPESAERFKQTLILQGARPGANGLYPIVMTEWGLHIYYHVTSLVNKKSISGHHSVWELQENAFAKDYNYQKGELPTLDNVVPRTVIFCVASRLTEEQKNLVRNAFRQACRNI